MNKDQVPSPINKNGSLPLQTQVEHQPIFKTKNFFLVIMAVLLLIATGTAGLFYFQIQKLSKYQTQTAPTPTASQAPNGDLANWKTYTNGLYTFQVKYPEKFNLTEDTNKKDFYDDLASLTYQNSNISIRAIYNIDIYQNSKPRDVADREVMDSGFKYSITDTTISGYTAAITILETTPKFHTIATIAHPNKNLFIQISSDTDRTELNQILSTFQFLN